MSKTTRPPLKQGGWETDTFTRWRRLYCYLARAGATSGIKQGYRRRVRHRGKQELRKQEREWLSGTGKGIPGRNQRKGKEPA